MNPRIFLTSCPSGTYNRTLLAIRQSATLRYEETKARTVPALSHFETACSRGTCHFQRPYLSPFFGQVTCVSPNVYRPPVTLSLPHTPWVPPPPWTSSSSSPGPAKRTNPK